MLLRHERIRDTDTAYRLLQLHSVDLLKPVDHNILTWITMHWCEHFSWTPGGRQKSLKWRIQHAYIGSSLGF